MTVQRHVGVARKREPAPSPSELLVLVCDSRPQSRKHITDLLLDLGYTVSSALVTQGWSFGASDIVCSDGGGAPENISYVPTQPTSQTCCGAVPAQVEAVSTTKQALQRLESGGGCRVDLVLKAHEPPAGPNACRLLRRMSRDNSVPVIGAWSPAVSNRNRQGQLGLTHALFAVHLHSGQRGGRT